MDQEDFVLMGKQPLPWFFVEHIFIDMDYPIHNELDDWIHHDQHMA